MATAIAMNQRPHSAQTEQKKNTLCAPPRTRTYLRIVLVLTLTSSWVFRAVLAAKRRQTQGCMRREGGESAPNSLWNNNCLNQSSLKKFLSFPL